MLGNLAGTKRLLENRDRARFTLHLVSRGLGLLLDDAAWVGSQSLKKPHLTYFLQSFGEFGSISEFYCPVNHGTAQDLFALIKDN